ASSEQSAVVKLPYDPFDYQRRETFAVDNIGGKHVPVVIADLSKIENITAEDLKSVGYTYEADMDKWNISDTAADYIFTGNRELDFALPGTLKVIMYYEAWLNTSDKGKYFPILEAAQYVEKDQAGSSRINFIMLDCFSEGYSQSSLDQ